MSEAQDPILAREAKARTRLTALNRAPFMAGLCAIQAGLFYYGLRYRQYPFHPEIWIGGHLLALTALIASAAWLRRRPHASLAPFIVTLFLLGCLWGWEASVVLPLNPPRGHFNAFTLGADLLMSVLITLAVYPPAIVAAGLPSAGLIAVLMFAEPDAPMIPWGLLTFLGFSYWLSLRIRKGIFQSHYLILRNQQLHQQVQSALTEKDRFLLGTAHDLRHPIQNLAMLLPSLPSRSRKSLQANLVSMRSLVDGLADLERLGQGLVQAKHQTVDLGRLFAALQAKIGGQRSFKAEPNQLKLSTDADLLDRLLSNLVHNALDYGTGTVTLKAKLGPQGTVLELQDQGRGLPVQAKAILEGKASGTVQAQKSQRGLGIGLIISRALADALGVKIEVRKNRILLKFEEN